METDLERGARIIIEHWMDVRSGDAVLIITEEAHVDEMHVVKEHAIAMGANVAIELLPSDGSQLSQFLCHLTNSMCDYDVIIGATHYSMITTKAVQQAVKGGSRFLSLPLSTNDGRSLLEYGFLTMDTDKSKFVAKEFLKHINQSNHLLVTTLAGTHINIYKVGRNGNYFNGKAKDGNGFASSSFEVYIPIEEHRTEGIVILDGSLGYLGKMKQPFQIRFEGGRLVEIAPTPCGEKLVNYIENFNDEKMYHATEFGIGTNFYSRCSGNSYIEDESAYGTCHIGFGRNIALGGAFEAAGHFDLVFLKPTIYADNRMIMENGNMIPIVQEIW